MAAHTSIVRAPADLGLALQQARLTAGLSQVQIAAALGISQRSVSEIESGKTTIYLRKLFDLMEATGVTLTATWPDAGDE